MVKLSIGQEKLLKVIVGAGAFGVSCPGFCERGKSAGWYNKAEALVRKGLARREGNFERRVYYRTPAGIDYVNGVIPEKAV